MNFLRFSVLLLAVSCLEGNESKNKNVHLKGPGKSSYSIYEGNTSNSRMGKIGKYIGAAALGLASFWIATNYSKSNSYERADLVLDQGALGLNHDLNSFESILDNENQFKMIRRDGEVSEVGEGTLGMVGYSISEEEFIISALPSLYVLGSSDFYATYSKQWVLQSGKGWAYSEISLLDSPVWSNKSPQPNGNAYHFSSFVPLSKNKVAMSKCMDESEGCSFHIQEATVVNGKLSLERSFSSKIMECSCDKSSQYVSMVNTQKYGLISLWSGNTNRGNIYLSSINLDASTPSLSTKILGNILGSVYSAELIEENYLLANILISGQAFFVINLDSLSITDKINNPAKGLTKLFVFKNGLGAIVGSNNAFPIEVKEGKINLGPPSNIIEDPLNVKGTKGGLIELSSSLKGVSWKFHDTQLKLVDEGEILSESLAGKDLRCDCLSESINCLLAYTSDGNNYLREIFFFKNNP